MKKKMMYSLLAICIAIAAPVMVQAQHLGGLPEDGGMDIMPAEANGTGAPFDFGIGMMAAAGIGYAAKKRRDQKRAKA